MKQEKGDAFTNLVDVAKDSLARPEIRPIYGLSEAHTAHTIARIIDGSTHTVERSRQRDLLLRDFGPLDETVNALQNLVDPADQADVPAGEGTISVSVQTKQPSALMKFITQAVMPFVIKRPLMNDPTETAGSIAVNLDSELSNAFKTAFQKMTTSEKILQIAQTQPQIFGAALSLLAMYMKEAKTVNQWPYDFKSQPAKLAGWSETVKQSIQERARTLNVDGSELSPYLVLAHNALKHNPTLSDSRSPLKDLTAYVKYGKAQGAKSLPESTLNVISSMLASILA